MPLNQIFKGWDVTSKVEQRLRQAGVTIPNAPSPAANYLPFTRNLVFVSGQVQLLMVMRGLLEQSVKMPVLKAQARQNMRDQPVSTLKVACGGDLDRCSGRKTWCVCCVSG